MSARIAPEPVHAIAAAAEYRARAVSVAAVSDAQVPSEPPAPRAADILPPLPLPPDPPGTMFAAAVMAGALPPKPASPEEAFLRLGTVWRPPESQVHLADHQA